DTDVAALAKRICDKPAAAVSMGKSLFYRQLETGIEAAYQMAGQTIACNANDQVAQEGMQAFIEKRTPNWRA
ncbi:MAG: enoyl-CoA hydratase, partial [Burkholderiales bacterium]|nr:enoyl-CoA hydratase [Burkholderiales bacterium]